MDASLPTWFLLHWVRDRGKYPIEDAIRRMTSDTAALFGVADRGVLAPGAFADVNVIDLDGLALELPEFVHDFPDRRGPLRAAAPTGYRATIVNGAVFVENGEPTGHARGPHAALVDQRRSGAPARAPQCAAASIRTIPRPVTLAARVATDWTAR